MTTTQVRSIANDVVLTGNLRGRSWWVSARTYKRLGRSLGHESGWAFTKRGARKKYDAAWQRMEEAFT